MEQMGELMRGVPHSELPNNLNNKKSEYVSYTNNTSDSYIVSGLGQSENILYSSIGRGNTYSVDCDYFVNCNEVYSIIDCINISNSQFCLNCKEGNNLYNCLDLT